MKRLPAGADLARRRRVWVALSTLFLDTELDATDRAAIAEAVRASAFTADEAEAILRREVGPVLWPNLVSVAGVWNAFDEAELEARILARLRFERWIGWWPWPPLVSGFRSVRRDWEAARALLEARPPQPARTVAAS